MKLKIVPKVKPNSDGEWIEVPTRYKSDPNCRSWVKTEELYADAIPDGYTLVGVESEPPEYPKLGQCNHASASWP
ncbi:hypothetical protein [Mesorhizobium sp. WSM2239]|uniref:Uncharacterized protein n=2 Tax=unclassified Mesorhizobium TaxID=325217 RepID=A0AAU8DFF5_9HYPH